MEVPMSDEFNYDDLPYITVTVAEVGVVLDPDIKWKDGIPDLVANMSQVINFVARANRAMEWPEFRASFDPTIISSTVHGLCHEVEDLGNEGFFYFMGFMSQFMDGIADAAQTPDNSDAYDATPEVSATMSAMMYIIRTVTMHWHAAHPEITAYAE
jgi:hypothetical protein